MKHFTCSLIEAFHWSIPLKASATATAKRSRCRGNRRGRGWGVPKKNGGREGYPCLRAAWHQRCGNDEHHLDCGERLFTTRLQMAVDHKTWSTGQRCWDKNRGPDQCCWVAWRRVWGDGGKGGVLLLVHLSQQMKEDPSSASSDITDNVIWCKVGIGEQHKNY